MKLILLIIGLQVCIAGFSQINADTLFLKRERTEKSYNIVYVVSDTSIEQYKWIVPTDITEGIREIYTNNYNFLLEDTIIRPLKHNFANLSNKWSCLYRFKNKYYVYSPSDWYFYVGIQLTDTTLIYHTGEGPIPEIILESKILSNNLFYLKTYSFGEKINDIYIYLIDKECDVAIWKIVSKQEIKYKLMVNSLNVKKFPMAINNCSIGKCFYEFNFEDINYEKLIKNAR